jgi:hypothetical protein
VRSWRPSANRCAATAVDLLGGDHLPDLADSIAHRALAAAGRVVAAQRASAMAR